MFEYFPVIQGLCLNIHMYVILEEINHFEIIIVFLELFEDLYRGRALARFDLF